MPWKTNAYAGAPFNPDLPQWSPYRLLADNPNPAPAVYTPEVIAAYNHIAEQQNNLESSPEYEFLVHKAEETAREIRRLKQRGQPSDLYLAAELENSLERKIRRFEDKDRLFHQLRGLIVNHISQRQFGNLNPHHPTLEHIRGIEEQHRVASQQAFNREHKFEKERNALRRTSVSDEVLPAEEGPGADKWANYRKMLEKLENPEAAEPLGKTFPAEHFKSQKSPPVSVPPHMAHGDEWQRAMTNRQPKHYKR